MKRFSYRRSFKQKKPELSRASVAGNRIQRISIVLSQMRYTLCAHCTLYIQLFISVMSSVACSVYSQRFISLHVSSALSFCKSVSAYCTARVCLQVFCRVHLLSCPFTAFKNLLPSPSCVHLQLTILYSKFDPVSCYVYLMYTLTQVCISLLPAVSFSIYTIL